MKRPVLPICLALVAALIAVATPHNGAVRASAHDPILLNAARYTILAGRFSVFAAFQSKLQTMLDGCHQPEPWVVPPGTQPTGQIGEETQQGIERALACGALKNIPPESAARHGAITAAVWHEVMPGVPPPDVRARTDSLILSFEATDFGDAPEWNLCQDGMRARYGPSHRKRNQFVCFNESDPCSFVTWGPRGATAGSGREIQYILWLAGQQQPGLLEDAFGTEYENFRRFLHLKGGAKGQCSGHIPLKTFLCAMWLDAPRRQIWETALAKLGHSPAVRGAYEKVYSLVEFDGEKLSDFYELWHDLGLQPTEIDFAFFLDRITHLGGPPDDTEQTLATLQSCIHHETQALTRNGAARRCLSRLQPRETQTDLRAARDVAFYLDAYPTGALTEAEVQNWAGYVPLSAVFNFGLSDSVPYPLPPSAPLSSLGAGLPSPDSSFVTEAEMARCPAAVSSPVPHRPAQ
jgi:hypothetical protein